MLADNKAGVVVASLTIILTMAVVVPQLIPLFIAPNGTTQSEDITDTTTTTPAPAGMLAYWELNENDGTAVFDSIGPYVHGLTSGNPTWIPGVAQSGLDLQYDQSINFDSSPDLYLPTSLTIEAWINLPDTSGLHTILMNSFSSYYIMYQFAIQDGALYFDRQAGTPGNFVTSSATIDIDHWYHVAVSMDWDAHRVNFYIDGVEQIVSSYYDGFSGPSGVITVGADRTTGASSFLLGMVDEVAVYDIVLEGSIIQEHYEKGLLGLGYLDDFPTNVPPVAVDDDYTIDQDTDLIISTPGLLLNDIDADGDPLEAVLFSEPAWGVISLNPDGSFVYSPAPGFTGMDYFEYRAFDGTDYSVAASVEITVESTNVPPVALDDAYVVDEDNILSVAAPGVMENDFDDNGDFLATDLVTSTLHGSLVLFLNGEFLYTPDYDWCGPDSFTYRLFDGLVYGNVATVTITVNPMNDIPVAVDDEYSGMEDVEIIETNLLDNDQDIDGDNLEAILVDGPSHGTFELFSDGSFTYLPYSNWFGIDSFTYEVYDGQDFSNIATVTLTILGVNDVPVAIDDEYSGVEDIELLGTSVLDNDYDYDADALEIVLVSDPIFGVLTLDSDGSFTFMPDVDWFGIDSFTYQVSDGEEYSNVATVTLTIFGANDAPVAIDVDYYAAESSSLSIPISDGLLTWGVSDIDSLVDDLTILLVDGPAVGTLTLNPDGSFDYSVSGWHGTVTFTYHAFDGTDYSNTATVTIYDVGDDDTTGPEITIMYLGDGTDGVPGSWTVSVTDPESGVDTITVEIDGILVGTTAGTYPVPNTLGIHTIIVVATNADLDTGPEDQETSSTSDSILIIDDDTTAPSIILSYTGDMTPDNPGFWTVTVSDWNSGVSSIVVEIDGVIAGTSEGDYLVPSSLGDHSITVTAINDDFDRPADEETSSLSDTVTIVDVVPPETLIELTGTIGLNEWYVSDVLVTLTVNEEASTAYSINGGPWMTYTGQFIVGLEGSITISYYSTDLTGNVEITKEASYRMDKTLPTLTYYTETIPEKGELVTIVASDEISGLFGVVYSFDTLSWFDYVEPFLLSKEGLVTVYFRAVDVAGNSFEFAEDIEVIIEISTLPTELLYIGDLSGVYSDPIYLEAQLVDATNQLPIPGKTILFIVGGQSALTVTDADGFASAIIILDQEEGIYILSVSYGGDDDYLASSCEYEFTIIRECAIALYTGVTVLEVSEGSINLMATVFDDVDGHWGDITRIYVTFTFYLTSDPLTPVYMTFPIKVQTTDTVGVGIAALEMVNLPEGEYLVMVNLLSEHNRYYCSPDSNPVTITIYEPERASAVGAGKIKDADGHNGYFAFNVRYNCKVVLKGFIIYSYVVDDWVYIIKSSDVMSLSTDGKHAFFEANCTINGYNFKTHEKYCPDDTFRVRIDAFDNKGNEAKDAFQIRVSDNIGLVEYEAGYDPYGSLLRGCIVVNPGRYRYGHGH